MKVQCRLSVAMETHLSLPSLHCNLLIYRTNANSAIGSTPCEIGRRCCIYVCECPCMNVCPNPQFILRALDAAANSYVSGNALYTKPLGRPDSVLVVINFCISRNHNPLFYSGFRNPPFCHLGDVSGGSGVGGLGGVAL